MNNKPGELISEYQGLIRGIVLKYQKGGYIAARESSDLIQEVNRLLLERLEKIQKQYNGKSSLRTYIAVIVKNICREKFRKLSLIEEPQSPEYYRIEESQPMLDNILLREEYQRFRKVIRLMFKDGARFLLIFRFMYSLKIDEKLVLELDSEINEVKLREILKVLNPDVENQITKKAKFKLLSGVLEVIEGSFTSAESLRKWFASRSAECVDMMNGHPPRSAYTIETLNILIEKIEFLKIVD